MTSWRTRRLLGMETESYPFALYCAAVILRAFFFKERED
jgi:hypothetical protein